MTLYHVANSCSLADHIVLIETRTPYTPASVDRGKRASNGRDFLAINPKGYVPALELEDGTILTENLAILLYLADRTGKLLPKSGVDRYRVLEALAFMTTEVHGNFKPFFFQLRRRPTRAGRGLT